MNNQESIKTTVSRDHYKKLGAKSYIKINDEYKLKVSSYKADNGITSTYLKAVKQEGPFETFVIFQDYHKRIASEKIARLTEKNLLAFHENALKQIEPFLNDAKLFYSQS